MLFLQGMPVSRVNSRGSGGIAAINEEFSKGRTADLSIDLFGLEDLMGPPSGPKVKRVPKEIGSSTGPSPRGSKKKGSPRGNSPKGSPGRSPGGRSRGQEKAAELARAVSEPTADGLDPWVNRNVKLKRGKYEGRVAHVLGKTEKKYQVQVEGVPYQLEFYSTMFVLPENYKQAKGRKKKKVEPEPAVNLNELTSGMELDMSLLGDKIVRTRSQENRENFMLAGL